MGWDVDLLDSEGNVVTVSPEHTFGSTYIVGGSDKASATITFNYSRYYYMVWKEGLMKLHGMKAEDAIPLLENAIKVLGTQRSESYWDVTPGNAGYALSVLLDWARQNPTAKFHITP